MMDVWTALLATLDPVWQVAAVVILACLIGSLLFLFTGRKEQVSEQEFEDFSPFFTQVKPVMHRYLDSENTEAESSDWHGHAHSDWEEEDSSSRREKSRYPG